MVANLLSSSASLNSNLGRVTNAAGNSIPYGYYAAAYGIAFSIQTCRVSAVVEETISSLSIDGLSDMLGRMVADKLTIGDVPAWLNEKVEREEKNGAWIFNLMR